MKNTFKKGLAAAITALSIAPLTVYAQGLTFAGLVNLILRQIIDPLIRILVALAIVYFIWGVVKYISHGGDENKRTEGYKTMIYGVIALFVIVSVWGLVAVLQNTVFGFSGAQFFAP